jgi:hypothetical protein
MAKKPAKKPMSNVVAAPKIDDGLNVLYIGLNKEMKHVCPECNKMSGKGILREYKGTLFCSKGCVLVFKKRESLV